ncbi:hypothetical protein ABZP36_031426 [Zizania latifolia]
MRDQKIQHIICSDATANCVGIRNQPTADPTASVQAEASQLCDFCPIPDCVKFLSFLGVRVLILGALDLRKPGASRENSPTGRKHRRAGAWCTVTRSHHQAYGKLNSRNQSTAWQKARHAQVQSQTWCSASVDGTVTPSTTRTEL